jgi:hypothetical protein
MVDFTPRPEAMQIIDMLLQQTATMEAEYKRVRRLLNKACNTASCNSGLLATALLGTLCVLVETDDRLPRDGKAALLEACMVFFVGKSESPCPHVSPGSQSMRVRVWSGIGHPRVKEHSRR